MRSILILILMLSPLLGMSQTVLFTGNPSMLTYYKGALGADSILKTPFADTAGIGALWPDSLRKGAIMVNSTDSMLYYHDGVKWKKVVGGGGGTADTNFIRNQNAYRQDGNFSINGTGETSLMLVTSGGSPLPDDNVDTSSYGLYVAKRLDPPYNSTNQGSSARLLSAISFQGFSAGNNARTSLGLYPFYLLDSMTNATGAVLTTGIEMQYSSFTDAVAPERPLIWMNTGILNHTYAAVNTGYPSVDSSVSNYGIISQAEWRKGTFSNREAKRYNLYLGSVSDPAPNYISGPTMFSKTSINDLIQNRDGGPAAAPGPSMDSFNQDFSVKILGNMVYKPGTEGAGKILTSSADGTVTISDPSAIIGGDVFVQDGNAFGETAVLGTTDNEALEIIAGGNTALRVNPDATVQYTDGTEGDNKILMSSADGTLSAQSPDSVLKGVWRSGVINNMGTQATLRANADTITIGGIGSIPLMQSVGNRMAFNDIVRNDLAGLRFTSYAPATGDAGFPIIFEARFPSGATGNRTGTAFRATGSTPTSISVLAIGRSGSPINTWVGIADENWHITAATNNYFIRTTFFQPSSTNWFLYTQNPVKSQLSGNLLLGATTDNGHKLQIQGGAYIQNTGASFNQLILAQPFTPDNTADTDGEVGAMAWDEDYIYIKTSAGWKRSALSTF